MRIVKSEIFGDGIIRNPANEYKYIEFAEPGKPRLWLWLDGTYSIGGPHTMIYSAHIDTIDDMTNEIKRLMSIVRE